VNKKICLSISGHHPETWQPSWSIRTALLALVAFMPSDGQGTIGALDYTPEERRVLAKKSMNWSCTQCGHIAGHLASEEAAEPLTSEESELVGQITFKAEDAAQTPTSEMR
jgi:ubiquitin-conjugating enzyme E2 J1